MIPMQSRVSRITQRLRLPLRSGFHSTSGKNVSNSVFSRRRAITASVAGVGLAVGGYVSYLALNPIHLDAAVPQAIQNRPEYASAKRLLLFQEVQKHNTKGSCWVIINGRVYDATSIVDSHPGGAAVLIKNSGKDVTRAFEHIHRPGALNILPPEAFLGLVDPDTIPPAKSKH